MPSRWNAEERINAFEDRQLRIKIPAYSTEKKSVWTGTVVYCHKQGEGVMASKISRWYV